MCCLTRVPSHQDCMIDCLASYWVKAKILVSNRNPKSHHPYMVGNYGYSGICLLQCYHGEGCRSHKLVADCIADTCLRQRIDMTESSCGLVQICPRSLF